MEGQAKQGAVFKKVVFPIGHALLQFNLGDPYVVRAHGSMLTTANAQSMVVGQMTYARELSMYGRMYSVGVQFKPTGLYTLLGCRQEEFTDQAMDYQAVVGAAGRILTEKLMETASWFDQAGLFDQFLLQQLVQSKNNTDRMQYALACIYRQKGNIAIDKLADVLGVSRRTLVRDFTQTTGLSPKLLARIIRFSGVMQAVARNPQADSIDLVDAFGYTDQAHLIKEFSHFTGHTPKKYFATQRLFENGFVAGVASGHSS
jgi:AraC-like DNA-binding protein